jgi:hypothetical protein
VDERFLESILHKRAPLLARARGRSGHVVLGRRLRPFSFWHQQLLESVESPFLASWKTKPSSIQIFKSLFVATEICRLAPLEQPDHGGWRAMLRRKVTAARFFLRPAWHRPGTRYLMLLIEAAKFRGYMADYCSGAIPFPTKNSRRIQSPGALYQLELYKKLHAETSRRELTPHELWGKTPAEISWTNTAAQEARGAEISIITPERAEARKIALQGGRKKAAQKK